MSWSQIKIRMSTFTIKYYWTCWLRYHRSQVPVLLSRNLFIKHVHFHLVTLWLIHQWYFQHELLESQSICHRSNQGCGVQISMSSLCPPLQSNTVEHIYYFSQGLKAFSRSSIIILLQCQSTSSSLVLCFLMGSFNFFPIVYVLNLLSIISCAVRRT